MTGDSGISLPVSFSVEGQVLPSGTINAGQTIVGSTTLVFPEDWVRSRPGTIQITTSYESITVPDVLDSLAGQIHVPHIRERLEKGATFTSRMWGKVVFN